MSVTERHSSDTPECFVLLEQRDKPAGHEIEALGVEANEHPSVRAEGKDVEFVDACQQDSRAESILVRASMITSRSRSPREVSRASRGAMRASNSARGSERNGFVAWVSPVMTVKSYRRVHQPCGGRSRLLTVTR